MSERTVANHKSAMRKAECSHPYGFEHDNRIPYRLRMEQGHKVETWRECCRVCGTWIVVERIDGVQQ